MMSLIPDLVVIDPCDATEIAAATMAIARHNGPVYLRLLRGKVPVVFEAAGFSFEIGKARLVRGGGDLGFISTGFMTERALDAAADLQKSGVNAGVLHVPTLKPFDRAAVVDFAKSVDRIVTAENHVVRGGLGTLVAETLFENGIIKRHERIGLPDRYIECGSVPTLQKRYGLTSDALVAAVIGGAA